MGGKIRQVLPGGTGAEKLDTFRRAMAGAIDADEGKKTDKATQIKEILATAKSQEDRRRKTAGDQDGEESDEDIPMPSIVGLGKDQDRWDVETILSTFAPIFARATLTALDSIFPYRHIFELREPPPTYQSQPRSSVSYNGRETNQDTPRPQDWSSPSHNHR